MRARILVFAAVVAIALALNLARLSLSIGQTGEDTVRARLAMSSLALKAQLDLLDARLSPRAVATMPDLIEATRAEPGQTPPRPDERALRAAASALAPEPDLVAVANPQGAILSRRGRPAAALNNLGQLPIARAALEGSPAASFATFDGATWRLAAVRVPGNPAAAVVGSLIDDRFAAQLKSQVDADVTLLQGGAIIASSLSGDERTRVAKWAAAPGPGYGVLRVVLPLVGTDLSGKLPRGTARFAVRAALVPADGGVQVALTVPASPYHAWLARYQAFYVAGLVLFVLFSLVWAVLARQGGHSSTAQPLARQPSAETEADDRESRPSAASPADVPWPSPEASSVGEASIAAREEEPRQPAWGTEAPPEEAPGAAAAAPEPGASGREATWGGEPEAGFPVAKQSGNGIGSGSREAPAGEIAASGSSGSSASPGDEPERGAGAEAALSATDERDPDEDHWRETFDRFKELKARLGEPADRISFEKFAAKLKKNRADLLVKHNCRGVRFSVYEKEGKAAIKASAIR